MDATTRDQTAREHAAASGARCTEGPNGLCIECSVAMERCDACGGVGYHMPSVVAPQCYEAVRS